MLRLIRNCFCGQPGRVTHPHDESADSWKARNGAANHAGHEDIPQVLYCMTEERPALPGPACARHSVGVHIKLPAGAGGLGTMYGCPYDILEPRTAMFSTPSFTLSAVGEDEADDEREREHAADYGAPAAAAGINPGDLSDECDPADLELCAYAILPKSQLSTVYEDTDGECCAPSGSCYSAEAGYCSNGRLPHMSLVRGLSAPSCAGSMGSGPGGAAPSCTARPPPPPSPPMATVLAHTATTRTAPTRSTAGAGMVAAAQRPCADDPKAVWLF